MSEVSVGRPSSCSLLSNLRHPISLGLALDATPQGLEACEWACKALGTCIDRD